MASLVLKVSAKTVAVAATALHSGAALTYNPQVRGFVIQADADTYLGGSGVTGATDGLLVAAGQTMTFDVDQAVGRDSYNLTQIYYIGGPCRLTVEDNET